MREITRIEIHKALTPIKPIGFSKGYHQLVLVLEVCTENWDFKNDLEDIYDEVAKLCKCNPDTIERNIRTLLLSIDYKKLSAMVGYEVDIIPTVKDFIEILVTYITRDFIVTI